MNTNLSTNNTISDLDFSKSSFLESISVQSVIEYSPVMVSPQTCLLEVLTLLNQTNDNCTIAPELTTNESQKLTISCVLVVENNQLIGLLTERDILRLTVENIDFKLVTVDQVMTRKLITLKESELKDIFIPLNLFRQYKIRHLPILDNQNQIIGLISTESIRQILRPTDLLKLRKIKEIMTSKVICATPETSLLKIAELLNHYKISSVVITQEKTKHIPLGLITESDIVQSQVFGLNLDTVEASSLINLPLFYLTPEHYLWDAQQEMLQRKVNHLIICNQGGELQGIVSRTSILQSLNPVEMSLLINILQNKITLLEEEKKELFYIKNEQENIDHSKKIIQVLLVEDSRTEATIITKILQNKNPFILEISVTHVLTLQEALTELNKNTFEVIILDLNLPDSQELDTLLIVKKHCPDIPVVVLSSMVADEVDFPLRCLHYGAQDYLTKDDFLSGINSNKQLLIRSIYYAIERKNIEKKLQKSNFEYSVANRKLTQQIEERKQIQASLQKLTNQLEIQVKSRVTNLKEVCEQLEDEVKKRTKIEAVLRFIVEGVYQAKGVNFFQSLVKYISQSLDIEYIIIGKLINNNKIKTIANYANGQILDNFEYDLANTPSEQVIKNKTFCLYKQNLQKLFPHSLVTKKLKSESYLGIPLLDSEGKVLGVIVALGIKPLENIELKKEIMEIFATRISSELERINIQKSLQDKTQLLNQVISTANEGITINNIKGKFVLYNPAMTEITGYSHSEANNNERYFNSLYPDEREKLKAIKYRTKLREKKPINNLETTIKTKSGDQKTLLISSSVIRIQNEELLLSIYRDITERVEYEQALKTINQELEFRVKLRTIELQATTSRLTTLMENLQHGVLILDETQRVILINQSFCDIFEIEETPVTLIGANFSDFFIAYQDYFTTEFSERYQTIINEQKMIINEKIEFQDGRIFEIDYIPIILEHTYSGNLWMYRDITESKNYQITLEKLTKQLQRTNRELSDFKLALDQAAIVAITNPKGVITYVNDNFCEISQYSKEELIGNSHKMLNSGYHSREFWHNFWQTISQGTIWRGEVKNRQKDGTFYWLDTVIIPFLNHNNKPWQYIAIRYDITAKKEAENALKEKFAVMEAAIDGIAILKDGKYTYLNHSHLTLFGYHDLSELIGKSWQELYSQQEINRFEENVFSLLAQEKHWQGEAIGKKKDGNIILEDVSLTLMDDGTLICICRDITDKKIRETNFRTIFEQAGVGIVLVSLDGHFLKFNQQFIDIFGYSEEELQEKIVFDLVDPEELEFADQELQLFLKGEIDHVSEDKRYRHKNGSAIWVHLRSSLVKTPLGKPDYFIAILEDITNKKQAENERDRYFDISLDLISIINFECQFKRLNPAWKNTLGYTSEDLKLHPFIDFVHPEDQEKTIVVMDHLITSKYPYKVNDFENRYRCKNGEYKWISWNCVSAPEEQLIYAIARDITERKNTEIALKKSLEKEQELNELKSRFISMTSHEFRTPLAVIGSSVGILKTFGHKLSEEQKKEHLSTIQTYIKHSTTLLDDILLLNRAETGKLSFNPSYFDLPEFCQSVIQDLQISTDKHSLIFALEGKNRNNNVYLDQKLIRQILLNLLSNSIKYSAQGGPINLDLIMEEQNITFRIKDSGIGIPPEDQKHLFESFHRANNVGTIQGTGLGLSIVKKCVELHQGAITFESKINEGSTFIVTIPLTNEN